MGARFADLTVSDGAGSVMVQVAVDLDRQTSSGSDWFGNWSDTQLHADAAWEYLVVTSFGEGSAQAKVYDTSFTDLATAECSNGLDLQHNAVEIQVPWSLLDPLAAVDEGLELNQFAILPGQRAARQ